MFTVNKLSFRNSKLVTIPIGLGVANTKFNFPYDRVLSRSKITGIQWIEGNQELNTASQFGGNNYLLANSVNPLGFVVTLRDNKNDAIVYEACLSTFGYSTNRGKIRRTNFNIQFENCYIKYTTLGVALPPTEAIALEIFYE